MKEIWGLIGENQREYRLRTGIIRVKGGAGRLHLPCSGQPICLTLFGGNTGILRGRLCHSV
jgi:hypothetical protein